MTFGSCMLAPFPRSSIWDSSDVTVEVSLDSQHGLSDHQRLVSGWMEIEPAFAGRIRCTGGNLGTRPPTTRRDRAWIAATWRSPRSPGPPRAHGRHLRGSCAGLPVGHAG